MTASVDAVGVANVEVGLDNDHDRFDVRVVRRSRRVPGLGQRLLGIHVNCGEQCARPLHAGLQWPTRPREHKSQIAELTGMAGGVRDGDAGLSIPLLPSRVRARVHGCEHPPVFTICAVGQSIDLLSARFNPAGFRARSRYSPPPPAVARRGRSWCFRRWYSHYSTTPPRLTPKDHLAYVYSPTRLRLRRQGATRCQPRQRLCPARHPISTGREWSCKSAPDRRD